MHKSLNWRMLTFLLCKHLRVEGLDHVLYMYLKFSKTVKFLPKWFEPFYIPATNI